MGKISILFCINHMNTGGVEKSLLALLRTLPRDRFEPHVALMRHSGELLGDIPADVPVHVIRNIERNWPRLSAPLRRARDISGPLNYLIAEAKGTLVHYYEHVLGDTRDIDSHFDIAVSYQGPSELLDWYVTHRIDARVKCSWIHFEVSKCFINRRTTRLIYPAFERVFIVSDSAKAIFDNIFPELSDKTRVFHNIVNADEVRRLSREYGIKKRPEAVQICTVGRVAWEKAPDIAMLAAKKLKEQGFAFDWHFVGNGNMLDECRKMAGKLGVDDCMHFPGLKPNPYPYMAAADIYVQPSRSEGYCITLAEARLFGMPVVCTPFPGSEQIDGQSNAQIVSFDPGALAEAIVRAAAMPRVQPPVEVSNIDDINLLIELCSPENILE